MLFVTRGRVQLMMKDTKTDIQIYPTQDYIVKHEGKNFIIFIGADEGSGPRAWERVRKFDQNKGFGVVQKLINPLLNAAIGNLCIEITITDEVKGEGLDSFEIVAVKIPGTIEIS